MIGSKYSAITTSDTWSPDENYYIFLDKSDAESPYTKSYFPKVYNYASAKGIFTRIYGDPWNYNGHSRINCDENMPLIDRVRDRFYESKYIYKYIPVENNWFRIFDPQSPAGDAFVQGKIDARQLRDSVNW